jgi:hypothetical protein
MFGPSGVYDQEQLVLLGLAAGKGTSRDKAMVLFDYIDNSLSGSIDKAALSKVIDTMTKVMLTFCVKLGIGLAEDGMVTADQISTYSSNLNKVQSIVRDSILKIVFGDGPSIDRDRFVAAFQVT